MGVAAVDIENDGDLDLFMSHLHKETNTFYLNNEGLFDDVTDSTGLGSASREFTGFGLGFYDFDHDGRLDVFIANGGVLNTTTIHDANDIYAEPDQLFQGLGGRRFEEVLPRGGTGEALLGRGRGAAFADLDNDGDIDIVVSNNNGRPHLLRNVAGERGNWIMFHVLDERGRHALGARLRIENGDELRWRVAEISYGYCTSNDPRVHAGLGGAGRVDRVTVHWRYGGVDTFGPFAANQVHTVRRGANGGTR